MTRGCAPWIEVSPEVSLFNILLLFPLLVSLSTVCRFPSLTIHSVSLEQAQHSNMDRRVEDFLNTYGYSDESPKFEQMRFLVFLGMPVNALRAMGVPVKFIDDHKRLVEKTSGDCTWFYIQGPQRQIQKMQTKPRTMQRDAGVIARPKSPDFAYRTPVSAPAETEFATFQTRLGENCCRNPERAKQYSVSPRSRLDGKQQQRRWKPGAETSY